MRLRLAASSIILALVLGTGASSPAGAGTATISVPLDEELGAQSFDAGATFQSIERVDIRWSGSVTPGLGRGDGVERPEDEWFEWDGAITAVIGDYSLGGGTHRSGTWEEAVDPLEIYQGDPWAGLLDGTGTITIGMDYGGAPGGVMVIPPEGTLESAELLITGVVTATGEIVVHYPSESGIVVSRRSDCVIEWASADVSENASLRIALVRTSGGEWVLTNSAKNKKGAWKWEVGKWRKSEAQGPEYADGGDYRIRISTLDGSVIGESESEFAIETVTLSGSGGGGTGRTRPRPRGP